MTIDKRLLRAGLAVAAMTLALASASSASASVWRDNGVKVSSLIELGLSGGELFETSEGNGMVCAVNATLTTEGGSTGRITRYETGECTGFGEFATCTLAAAEAQGLPWTVDVNASDLTITGWHTRRTFNAGCGTTEINKTIGSITVTLGSPTAITEMEFAGETTGFRNFGSLAVEGANSGTYGIG